MSSTKITKQRAQRYDRRISAAKWEDMLPKIKQLYIDEDMPLAKVIECMSERHHFVAKEKQYWYLIRKNPGLSKKANSRKRGLHNSSQEQHREDGLCDINTVRKSANLEDEHKKEISRVPVSADSARIRRSANLYDQFTSSPPSLQVSKSAISPASNATPIAMLPYRYKLPPPHYTHRNPTTDNHPQVHQQEEPFYWHQFLDSVIPSVDLPTELLSVLTTYSSRLHSSSSLQFTPLESYICRMKSLFWPEIYLSGISVRMAKISMLQFMISTLYNNMAGSNSLNLSHEHKWITALPRKTTLEFFSRIREEERAIFRDRIIAAAIDAYNEEAIKLMMNFEPDFGRAIYHAGHGKECPIILALRARAYGIAMIMTEYQCRKADPKNLRRILGKVVDFFEHHRDHNTIDLKEYRNILRVIVHELGSDTDRISSHNFFMRPRSFAMLLDDAKTFKRMLQLQQGHVTEWLRKHYLNDILGFLDRCMHSDQKMASSLQNIFNWIAEDISRMTPVENSVCLDLIRNCSLQHKDSWFEPMLREFLDSLQFRHPSAVLVELRPEMPLHQQSSGCSAHEILEAIRRGDPAPICHLAQSKYNGRVFWEYFEQLVASGQRQMVRGVLRFARNGYILDYTEFALAKFMWKNDFEAIRVVVISSNKLDSALLRFPRTGEQIDLCQLEYSLFKYSLRYSKASENIFLRAVAYLAIEANDKDLLEFTIVNGVMLQELSATSNNFWAEEEIKPFGYYIPVRLGIPKPYDQFEDTLPSLLAVAAMQNRSEMMEVLVAHGANPREGDALAHVVKYSPSYLNVQLMLDFAVDSRYGQRGYGAAGLTQAIRQQNYQILNYLGDKTGINSMDRWRGLTALGAAILARDVNAMQILIKHGADPNRVAAKPSWMKCSEDFSCDLFQLTPILLAIHAHFMSALPLLVEHGALIENLHTTWLQRSPLQYAAEVGNSNAIEYLMQKGARVDYNEILDSGTALQLAAIKGFVGIARFLLKYGADVNALPAKGEGRTALEGAAEWGRPDMILLLIKHGVDFDLTVGEKVEPQGSRAMRFAEEAGHPAVGQYVEYWWKKQKDTNLYDWLSCDSMISSMEEWYRNLPPI